MTLTYASPATGGTPSVLKTVGWIRITPRRITLNGQDMTPDGAPLRGAQMLSAAYRQHVGGYPKFFKMDTLCKAGFLAAELLAAHHLTSRFQPREDVAVAVFSRAGSLCTDANYQSTIRHPHEYFPSPSVFVYTLANIVTGEICIRNKFEGESACYVMESFLPRQIADVAAQTFADGTANMLLCGWVECTSDDDFNVLMTLITK